LDLRDTQTLFRLVGLQKAMDLILTGKEVLPADVFKMGLVDLDVAPKSFSSRGD
jgi:3-hydroxyacyl-CoA dehydrogenase / enoyl-CoA hydratase / 3-hydroxybutyryl-CoA epimerase